MNTLKNVILADILLTVDIFLNETKKYSGNISTATGIVWLWYITVDKYRCFQVYYSWKRYNNWYKIVEFWLRKFLKNCCWFSQFWISQISPRIIWPFQNPILSCAYLHSFTKLPFPYIHQIVHLLTSTLSLLTKSLLVELTQLCLRGLARKIYKSNNSPG